MNRNLIFVLMLSFSLYSCGEKSTLVPETKAITTANNMASTFKLNEFEDQIPLPKSDDEYSYEFAEMVFNNLGLPNIVDLSEYMTSVKNQGDRGTCSFFTSVGLLESAIKEDFNKEVNISEEYAIYKTQNANKRAQDNSYEDLNLNAIWAFGFLLERDMPYAPEWFKKGLPCEKFKDDKKDVPLECFSHEGPHTDKLPKAIPGGNLKYEKIDPSYITLVGILGLEKRPVIINLIVNTKGWPDSGDVFYNEELHQECLKTPSECGGHSIILTGFDFKKKIFFFKNSWGIEWGNKGYGTVSFETVRRFRINKAFYIPKLKEEFDLPADYATTVLPEVKINSALKQQEDGSIQISATGEIKNVGNYYIYTTNVLTRIKKEALADPLNKSVPEAHIVTDEEVPLNNQSSAMRVDQYFTPNERSSSSIIWSDESPMVATFKNDLFKIPSVDKLLHSEEDEVFFRTAVYAFTDEGLSPLRRIWVPLAPAN